MRWLYSFLAMCWTALSLLSCIFCLVDESSFSCIVKYCQMGKVLYPLLFYSFVWKHISAQFYIQEKGNQKGGHNQRVDWSVSKHWVVLHWDARLGCSTLRCQRDCNAGGQLSNRFTAAIENMAKMCWLYSILATCQTAMPLLSCIFCLVDESGFLLYLKILSDG